MSNAASRPRLHFTPRSGWINDPLGLTVRDGTWHVFFQYVPGQTSWSPAQHWGHATSPDGLRWQEGPVALSPGDGDGGVWSGSIVQPDGENAWLFYTVCDLSEPEIGRARVARADDPSWTTWTKGPVVATLPADVEAIAFRDPFVFHDGECWRMLMGAGLSDGTATALTFRSDDVEAWTYDGLLAGRHRDEVEPVWTGAAWECPQLFLLEGRWVLTVSVWEPGKGHYEAYAVGAYVDGRFLTEHWSRLTYGSYYAGSTFVDGEGRRGLVHWLVDAADPADGWAGALSVPHVLHLDAGRLVARPHPSVTARRQRPHVLRAGDELLAPATCDVEWRVSGDSLVRFTDPSGFLLMVMSTADDELRLETGDRHWSMPLTRREVRMLLDGPVVEIFTHDGTLSTRVPVTTDTVRIYVAGAEATVYGLS